MTIGRARRFLYLLLACSLLGSMALPVGLRTADARSDSVVPPSPKFGANQDKSIVGALATSITDISPAIGTGGTKVVLTAIKPFPALSPSPASRIGRPSMHPT